MFPAYVIHNHLEYVETAAYCANIAFSVKLEMRQEKLALHNSFRSINLTTAKRMARDEIRQQTV